MATLQDLNELVIMYLSPSMAEKIRIADELLDCDLLTPEDYKRMLGYETPVILTPREGFTYYGDGSEPCPPIVCECGGEKTKTPHSHWCPKHKED